MGILYYAVNTDTKQAYELGKGGWLALCDDGRRADVSEPDRVVQSIRSAIITYPGWEQSAVDDGAYHVQIANGLAQIGPIVEIRDDSNWDDPLDGIKLIGTRYID